MASAIPREEFERRDAGVRRLCAKLGTSMAFICDPLLTRVMGIPSVDPSLLERWLERTGRGVQEGESLRDALARNYGKEIADLAESLV